MILTRQALDRFLKNTCGEQEAEYIRQYLSRNPEAAKALLENEELEVYNEKNLEKAISNKMKLAIQQETVHRFNVLKLVKKVGAIAASLLIIISGIFWYRSGSGVVSQQQAASIKVKQPKVYQNDASTANTIWLEDSTRIVLYANTAILVDTAYNVKSRHVEVKGEADFFVAHNKQKPFVVHAGKYTTTALGTAFKVVSGTADKSMTVKLFNGKVKVEHVNGAVTKLLAVLKPGDEVAVANGAAIVLNKIVAAEIKKSIRSEKRQPATIAETKAGISVVKMALPLVLVKLENEYQAAIRFNEQELIDISVTATFSSKETLSSILEQIALLNDLNLSKDGSTYVITKE